MVSVMILFRTVLSLRFDEQSFYELLGILQSVVMQKSFLLHEFCLFSYCYILYLYIAFLALSFIGYYFTLTDRVDLLLMKE